MDEELGRRTLEARREARRLREASAWRRRVLQRQRRRIRGSFERRLDDLCRRSAVEIVAELGLSRRDDADECAAVVAGLLAEIVRARPTSLGVVLGRRRTTA